MLLKCNGHFNPENASCIMWATIETSEQMHCIMWDTIATEATKTGSVRAISTLKALHDVGYYGNL